MSGRHKGIARGSKSLALGRNPRLPTAKRVAVSARLDPVFAGLALITSLYVVWTTIRIIRNAYFPIPLFDGWDHWRSLLVYGNYRSFLFRQHNEHRIALARLFFFVDHYAFQARSIFVLVCSSLFQTTTALLLWRLFQRSAFPRRSLSILTACFAVCLLFSGQQFTNLTWAFQIQFVAVYCTAVAALAALASLPGWLAASKTVWWSFLLVCLLALLSTYSMANGLLVWFILIGMSVWLRLPARYSLLLCAGSIIVTVLYRMGYQNPPQTAKPLDSLTHHLPLILAFATTYLGSPIDPLVSHVMPVLRTPNDTVRLIAASAFGAIGIVAAAAAALALWRRGRGNPWQAALLHVLFFVLATAGIVGMGRINFPLIEAMTSRYVTPAMVFWCALALLWISIADVERSPGRRGAVSCALLIWIVLGVAWHQPRWIQYSIDYGNVVREAQAAIAAGVYDDQPWHVAFHTPSEMFSAVNYLRNRRLSVFAEDWTRWTGTPLASHFQVDSKATCSGHFDQARLVKSEYMRGSRLSGWAWDPATRRGPGTVILADAEGRIAGVARGAFSRPDVVAAVAAVRTPQTGWVAYIAGVEPRQITAYLLKADGRSLCSLGTLPSGVSAEEVPFTQLVGTVPNIHVAIEGSWTRNGQHPDAGSPPVEAPVYGSWLGSDSNTGTLTMGPFRIANQLSIAIPVYSELANGGLSVNVIDARTKEKLAKLSPPPLRRGWWAWRVDLPVGALQLRPHRCRHPGLFHPSDPSAFQPRLCHLRSR